MQRFALLVGLFALYASNVTVAQDAIPNGDAVTTKETELLKKENELLKKEVEQLKAEIAGLKKEQRAKAKPVKEEKVAEDDQFAVGTVWTGTRFYNGKGGLGGNDGKGQPWTLEITKRTGGTIEGTIGFEGIDNKQVGFSVKGTAPTGKMGPVKFESEKKGLFKQYYDGRLDAGGEISTSFRGTNVPGTYVEGRTVLRKK